jgi:putative transposase
VSCYRFIAAEKATSSVVRLCRALGVSTSGFYDWQQHQPSARARIDAVLVDRIRDVHAASHCTYGAPRVHAELRAAGTRIGKKRVARLMRTAGLAGRCPKRFRRTTIRSMAPAAEPPDLVHRDFNPAAPDELWVSDITYVRTWEGWLYLAVILDAFSRRVVGWALADHLHTELATDALQMALANRRPAPGLVHHSDRGGQYLSASYIGLLAEHGVRSSVGRPGTCWDSDN